MYFYNDVEFLGNVKRLVCYKNDDGLDCWLPDGEANVYYQQWVAEGNTPEPWEAPDAD